MTLSPIVQNSIHKQSHLISDEHRAHFKIGRAFANHSTINHGRKEYVRDNVHTNTAESFGSLLERVKWGVFHYMSQKHLPRYLDEISFRWNHRIPVEKITKNGNLKKIMKPVPFMAMIASLLSGCIGKQLRRTKNFGIQTVTDSCTNPYFCL